MTSLPILSTLTYVDTGTGGPRGNWFPFRDKKNAGVLTAPETELKSAQTDYMPVLHTPIINSPQVTGHILQTSERGQTA